MSDTGGPIYSLGQLNGLWVVLRNGEIMAPAEIVEELKQLHAAIRIYTGMAK